MKSLLNLKKEEKELTEILSMCDPTHGYYTYIKKQLIAVKKTLNAWGKEKNQVYQIM